MQAARAQFKAEESTFGICTYKHTHTLTLLLKFCSIFDRFPWWQSLSLTSWWESPPLALPAPRPQTEACWWSCTCSTVVLRQSLTWKHRQLLHKAPTLTPCLCEQANDPESRLTTLFFILFRDDTLLSEHWSVYDIDSLWLQRQKDEIKWQLSKHNSPWMVSFSTQNNIYFPVRRQTHLPLFDYLKTWSFLREN